MYLDEDLQVPLKNMNKENGKDAFYLDKELTIRLDLQDVQLDVLLEHIEHASAPNDDVVSTKGGSGMQKPRCLADTASTTGSSGEQEPTCGEPSGDVEPSRKSHDS